jgi:serine/threonine protein kinase
MALTGGQTFAGYRILRLLGSGGMGEVYLVEHPRLPRRNALKVLPADVSANPDYRARFSLEADLASKLWHPHIVSVHDRGEHDGQLWISMDYVDGMDAGRLLAHRHPDGLPTDQAVGIISAIASALDYAHRQGLLHRDVKPANIMLTEASDDGDEQRILLSDFGIARNIDEVSGLTATNFTVGTVAYSAPEQLTGDTVDGRADQYALAATAYELLTGSLLFPDANPAVVIGRHLTASPPQLAQHRSELAALDPVLARALSKNPAERFVRCADFMRALTDSTQTASREAATAPTTPAPAAPKPADKQETAAAQRQSTGPSRLTDGGTSPPVTTRAPRIPKWLTGVATTIGVLITIGGLVSVFGHDSPPGPSGSDTSTPQAPTPAAQAPASTAPTSSAPPPVAPINGSIAGMIVMLDPVLNGANDASTSRQVPNGRGGTTVCQVTGNATDDGYPEHTFDWDVTLRVRAALNALGARTAMSRGDDSTVGPCIDQRAAMGNALHPSAMVSIGADIGPPDDQGFYVVYSAPPLNAAQAGPAVQFAEIVRDQMHTSGISSSSAFSQDGLRGRANFAELNLAQYPAVEIVCGNVKNAGDAASMESPEGRQKYADAIVRGIAAFLLKQRG